ncbi:MAG: helix-turn-helix domain-containing protein [Pseudomonadota bacterium]
MTGNQIKAARALLEWSQAHLAEQAGLSLPTVERAEGKSVLAASERAVLAIQTALEAAGVEFIPQNGGGLGLRLRK